MKDAKIEAHKLIDQFEEIEYPDGYQGMTEYEAIHCALITVKRIIKTLPIYIIDEEIGMGKIDNPMVDFWKNVKKELKNEL